MFMSIFTTSNILHTFDRKTDEFYTQFYHKFTHHSFLLNDILQFTHDNNNTEHIKCLLMSNIRKNLIVGHK